MSEFLIGINMPWIDGQYDHDFGYNMTRKPDITYEPVPTFQKSKENFEQYIQDISSLGIKVVRLWLFERFEGLTFSNTGHIINPTSDMFANLRQACTIAQKYNVKFYFCLMDTWGVLAHDLRKSPKGDPRKRYADILNGMITTADKRQSFLSAAADILSDSIIKNSVWAVDVLNEPDGVERTGSMFDYYRGRIDTGITWNQLYDYINDACSTIKKKTGHKVSCGIREEYFEKFIKHIKNTVDFYDIHKYHNEGELKPIKYQDKECYIGECGQGDRFERNDILQKTAVEKFIINAKNLGYSGCFIWDYGYKGTTSELSLINYDGSHRPAVEAIKKLAKKS